MSDNDYTKPMYTRPRSRSGYFDNQTLADGSTATLVGGTGKKRTYKLSDGSKVTVWKGTSPDDYAPPTSIPRRSF